MITVSEHALSLEEQRLWIDDTRAIISKAPLRRPHTPGGKPMRVRVSAAGDWGWTADGEYRYDSQQKNGDPWPEIPERWVKRASEVAGDQPWDSAIINWYEEGASLGFHVDKNERDLTRPIVTFSLGDACSWAVQYGGRTHRQRLESGAITHLSGSFRLCPHSVERIIPSPLLSPLRVRGRVSVTMRVAG